MKKNTFTEKGRADVLSISTFKSEKSNSAEERTLSWAELATRLTTHRVGSKNGPSWSPAVFRGGKRSVANVVEVSCAVLDCDSGTYSLRELEETIRALGYAAVISSSHSHTFDKPKFRVVVAVKRAWRRDDYPDASVADRAYKEGLADLERRIGVRADPAAKDLARLYFDPRYPQGATPEFRVIPGQPADIWPEPSDDDEEDADWDWGVRPRENSGLPFAVFSSAVMAVRNDVRFDRRKWIAVLIAIKSETGGSEEGRQLAERWSATWSAGPHDQSEFDKVWASLDLENIRVGGSHVRDLALRDGWVPPEEHDSESRAPHGDLWNGARFAEEHRGKLLYVDAIRAWYRWNGSRWLPCSDSELIGLARRLSQKLVDERREEYETRGGEKEKELLTAALRVHRSLDRVKKIPAAAVGYGDMTVRDAGAFDRDPMLLNLPNGILDLTSRQLRPAAPTDRLSKIAGASFDPMARAPLFISFLERIMPDVQERTFLQRAAGYTLTGRVDEEVLFYLFGIGANGKSVFANILAALLADYAVTLSTTLVTKNKHQNEAERSKVQLVGCRLGLVNEVGLGDAWDDQRILEITSRERIAARLLHKESFHFYPSHKLWIRGNHLPEVQDAGYGFWRRLIPIRFGVQIPEAERVPDLDRRIIEAELSGVLNWTLEGLEDWQKHGLAVPASVLAIKEQYQAEADLIEEWIKASCLVGRPYKLPVRDGYDDYRAFCALRDADALSKKKFSLELSARGYRKHPNNAVRKFVGIGLKVDNELI